MTALELTGRRFGKLTVVERVENYRVRTIYPIGPARITSFTRWRCVCDCGRETVALGTNLVHGRTKSCGCGKRGRKRNAE